MYGMTADRDMMTRVLCDLGYQRMHTWLESHGNGGSEYWQGPEGFGTHTAFGTDNCVILSFNADYRLESFRQEKKNMILANRLLALHEVTKDLRKLLKLSPYAVPSDEFSRVQWIVTALRKRPQMCGFSRMSQIDVEDFVESWTQVRGVQVSSCGTASWIDFRWDQLPLVTKYFRVRSVAGHPNEAVEFAPDNSERK